MPEARLPPPVEPGDPQTTLALNLHPPVDLAITSPTSFFGTSLEPSLLDACGGRLETPRWFRTDWQRGGALTGYARFTPDGAEGRDVVVKLPVPPQELTWLQRLQEENHDLGQIVPRLCASGRKLGGYDLAWAVMQRLEHGPLDSTWGGAEMKLVAEAAGRFYAASSHFDVDAKPRNENWPDVLRRSRAAVREHQLAQGQRWNAALKAVQKKFKKLLGIWDERDTAQWCHGDLHLGNAMTSAPPPDGPAFVFDLAMVHAGHWVEDAIYMEHLYWAHPRRLAGVDLPRLIADQRRARGLPGDSQWPRLARIRRVLLAAATPAEHVRHPSPARLAAALGVLERETSSLT
ncbi:MAG: aminoglycoside phosphotransferase family protein [Phycisphaerae bacterium]|nr:aminoglycoside phosphotransferase family protein [Phycisphaerae bacterium]